MEYTPWRRQRLESKPRMPLRRLGSSEQNRGDRWTLWCFASCPPLAGGRHAGALSRRDRSVDLVPPHVRGHVDRSSSWSFSRFVLVWHPKPGSGDRGGWGAPLWSSVRAGSWCWEPGPCWDAACPVSALGSERLVKLGAIEPLSNDEGGEWGRSSPPPRCLQSLEALCVCGDPLFLKISCRKFQIQ